MLLSVCAVKVQDTWTVAEKTADSICDHISFSFQVPVATWLHKTCTKQYLEPCGVGETVRDGVDPYESLLSLTLSSSGIRSGLNTQFVGLHHS